MIRLSVNINKIATLRNARGGNMPDVVKTALEIESFGADGITVHPRPDERHIRYRDVMELRPLLSTEFNIEGYPSAKFIDLVLEARPDQVTLVPDPPDAITSDAGWDTFARLDFLKEIIPVFHNAGIRTSLFVDPDERSVEYAAVAGAKRVELYTEAFARNFTSDPSQAAEPYVRAAIKAKDCGLELNAGHDLNLDNLNYFAAKIPWLAEVSIGHALICDALWFGLENTVRMYKAKLVISQVAGPPRK